MAKLKAPTQIGGLSIDPRGPSVGDALIWDGAAYVPLAVEGGGGGGLFVPVSGGTMTGFLTLHADPSSGLHASTKQYVDALTALPVLVYFTANGAFTKASYPGMRAVRVRLVGGGGAGGGAAVLGRSGGGGGGGGYAEKTILVAALATSETVTIGAGGTSVAGDTDGGAGGTTSFGAHASATGGVGGGMGSDPHGGPPGVGTIGDFLSAGQGGMPTSITVALGSGLGGGSLLGGGAEGRKPGVTTAGADALGYGGGGSGAHRNANGNSAGGAGKAGVCIAEVLY